MPLLFDSTCPVPDSMPPFSATCHVLRWSRAYLLNNRAWSTSADDSATEDIAIVLPVSRPSYAGDLITLHCPRITRRNVSASAMEILARSWVLQTGNGRSYCNVTRHPSPSGRFTTISVRRHIRRSYMYSLKP